VEVVEAEASTEARMSSGGRALGIGLLAGAAGVTLLMLLWLVVGGASGGGVVLGLLLTLVLAGPLAGVGWYVLSRQPEEQRSAVAFARKQRILDSDRVFRAQTAGSLRAMSSDPALPGGALRTFADELQDTTHTTAAWQDMVQLDDAGIDTLRRYDDLVRERVRRLRDNPQHAEVALRELRQAVDQREDLLVRGYALPGVEASQLLTTDAQGAGALALEQIRAGDAVSRGPVNYVVENLAVYFAEGQRWRLARLVPTGPDASVAWLYVGPGALEIALLDEVPAPSNGAPEVAGVHFTQVGAGTAVADVTGGARTAQGALVAYVRFRDDGHLAIVERWPDDVTRAYAGPVIKSSDLDLWPAQAPAG
jgi:hypothetical protein